MSLVFFLAAIHLHLLYGFDLVFIYGRNRCLAIYQFEPFFLEIWSWVDLFVFAVLPWLCLAVSNSLLVWKLKVSVREAEVSLGSGQADRTNDRKKAVSSITVTLISVSSAFLVLTFPISFIQITNFVYWMSGLYSTLFSSRVCFYFKQFSFPLWYANSSINFYIYCLTGTKFRKDAKQLLICRCHEKGDKASANETQLSR